MGFEIFYYMFLCVYVLFGACRLLLFLLVVHCVVFGLVFCLLVSALGAMWLAGLFVLSALILCCYTIMLGMGVVAGWCELLAGGFGIYLIV